MRIKFVPRKSYRLKSPNWHFGELALPPTGPRLRLKSPNCRYTQILNQFYFLNNYNNETKLGSKLVFLIKALIFESKLGPKLVFYLKRWFSTQKIVFMDIMWPSDPIIGSSSRKFFPRAKKFLRKLKFLVVIAYFSFALLKMSEIIEFSKLIHILEKLLSRCLGLTLGGISWICAVTQFDSINAAG